MPLSSLTTSRTHTSSGRVLAVWTTEEMEIIAKEFMETDKSVFGGRLYSFGVRLNFMPQALTKDGTYQGSTKTIIMNANGNLSYRIHTLWHEMIHAYDHLNRGRHDHDRWFWFTLGQLASLRGAPILNNFHQHCPECIVFEHRLSLNKLPERSND